MGSSKKHLKTASSKARRHLKDKSRKRQRDALSSCSDDFFSSSDSENNRRTYKKNRKMVKKRSRRSPSPEVGRSRSKRVQSKQRSRSAERKKGIKKKRKMSGRSYSSSTCSDGSCSSSDEKEFERARKIESRRSRPDEKRKRRYKSPSPRSSLSRSSCSKSSHESPKQVGSVVPVPKEMEETKGGQRGNNAEIIQSYDDYPSSRSNDSTDCGRIRQTESDDITKMPTEMNKVESFSESGNSKIDDLEEAQLRQKALENLAKFRFRQLASSKVSSSLKDEGAALNHVPTGSQEKLTDLRYSGAAVPNNVNVGTNEPRRSYRVRSLVVAANVNEEPTSVESGVNEFRRETLVAEDTPHGHTTDALKSACQSSNMCSINVNEPKGSTSELCLPPNSKTECDTYNEQKVEAGRGSHLEQKTISVVQGQELVEQKGEAGGGSHLQQKTMSVMRGGELVQVTYKVHIPKTTPALAKRRLQR